MQSEAAVIEARGIRKSYGDTPILRGVDFDVLKGERIALMGPSGAGKSTLLNCLGGIEPIDDGQLSVHGVALNTMTVAQVTQLRRTQIGTIFQFFHLLPTLTAEENIELPLQLLGIRRAERRERVQSLLQEVGIEARAQALPRQLSGGEQQRVAIARAIAVQPSLLLADEPTGSLDSKNADRILDLIERVSRERGLALVMVTHELKTTRICNRVVHLLDGLINGPTGEV